MYSKFRIAQTMFIEDIGNIIKGTLEVFSSTVLLASYGNNYAVHNVNI